MYDVVEREYIAEKKAAAKEFEEKKIEIRENLLNDFEDKRRAIENERNSMELNGDSMEVCCPSTPIQLQKPPLTPFCLLFQLIYVNFALLYCSMRL